MIAVYLCYLSELIPREYVVGVMTERATGGISSPRPSESNKNTSAYPSFRGRFVAAHTVKISIEIFGRVQGPSPTVECQDPHDR
jgi:hypothetical protein